MEQRPGIASAEDHPAEVGQKAHRAANPATIGTFLRAPWCWLGRLKGWMNRG